MFVLGEMGTSFRRIYHRKDVYVLDLVQHSSVLQTLYIFKDAFYILIRMEDTC